MSDVEPLVNTRRVFRDNLNLWVGPGRRYSVDAISASTGIGVDAIRRYLRGESCPEWHNAIALMAVIGPEFASAVLAPAGLGGVQRMEDGAAEGSHVLSSMLASGATLAQALEDNRIDHQEAADLAPKFERLGVECIQFARSLKVAR